MEFQVPFAALAGPANLDEQLTREESAWLGREVVEGWLTDRRSRAEWEVQNRNAYRLALQVSQKKTTPWEGASNVLFPLLTVATLQFSSRAYSALIKTPEVVKIRTLGPDPQGGKRARANRVAQHMSWQMLERDDGWEEEHDKALMAVPIIGCTFLKTYYDQQAARPCTNHVLAWDLVVNYWAKSLGNAERVTHQFYLSEREIRERQLDGTYSPTAITDTADQKYSGLPEAQPFGDTEPLADARQGTTPPGSDRRRPRLMLEQHTWFDLDGDGYPEPYVATVDQATGTLLRLVNRFEKVKQNQGVVIGITPLQYFTKLPFVPAPDGGFYDLGFGALLGPINEAVNTLINQLIDAGTLANLQSGFIGRGARIPGGRVAFKPGEWKRVDVAGQTLKDAIVPLPAGNPSPVLFQLLGLLISYGERIASVTEASMGENPGQNTPAYNMNAMLTQGMAVFNGIFKRLYRGLRDEFRKWYVLNQLYLPDLEYFALMDGPSQVAAQQDYLGDPTDIVPAADPNAVLSEEKQRQAMLLAERSRAVPGYNVAAVELLFLEAMGVQDIPSIFPVTPDGQPAIPAPPDPEAEVKLADMQRKLVSDSNKDERERIDLQLRARATEATIELQTAQTVKTYAEAGAVDAKILNERANTAIAAQAERREAMKVLIDAANADADRRTTERVAQNRGNGKAA